ncbi:MAG: anthranilate synthase component I [Gloeomargarita sp. DG02_4_bins_56]
MNWDTFQRLSEQGNFIPVYQQWPADLDTPVSAWYRVCRGQPYNFLLESVEGGERMGRYSVLGCDPLWVLTAWGEECLQVFRDGRRQTWSGHPFAVIQACLAPYQPVTVPELPPGLGGLFGFWGYELIRWIEPTVPVVTGGDLPDGCWLQMDHLLVFDQVRRQIWAVAYGDVRNGDVRTAYQQAQDKVQQLLAKLAQPLQSETTRMIWQPGVRALEVSSDTTGEAFQSGVQRAKDYIHRGDIFQVVLSQELSTSYTGDPFLLYRSLRLVNPSPYMAFFQFGEWQLIGSSPEVMVKTEGRLATVRPIAGTRPRGSSPAEDDRLAQELLRDPKEVAEHVMLVDLARNDLGRVAARGTVRVDQMMVIEKYSHVMHIVSNVVGTLASEYTAWDALQACFPAGTVSGAPKIRAMQLIYELEQRHRGPYAGCYGYYDFEGQLNTAITLRTMVLHQGRVRVRAGAGVVADSDPEREYQETWNKARGLLTAIAALGEV